jgi:tyrosyl-tRNA synthetase
VKILPSVFDTLSERGFIAQTSDESAVRRMLENEKVSFYSGFDPTADSLTVGHFLPIMAATHMQRAGHRPIILVGGGTGIIGDPTDKTDMRRMMTMDEIQHNCDCFKRQLSRFLDFGEGGAIMVNNAEWLLNLKYIPFIREYGIHFSVNKMLTADAYRTRFERGLTFFEFNYMLMQAYDFLELYRRYNCKLQVGGNDQWSNILAGVDLIRRVEKDPDAECMTIKLLLTSEGKKMGKSQKGAVWLDPAKTTPYEFYQYWRNVNDADVINFIKMLTFLPLSQIDELAKLEGSELNEAKSLLAFEVTKEVHGEAEAIKAQNAAQALFSGAGEGGSIPTTEIPQAEWNDGMNIIDLLDHAQLISTRSEGRRLIQQGGIKLNEQKVADIDYHVSAADIKDGRIKIQKGKKIFHYITIS